PAEDAVKRSPAGRSDLTAAQPLDERVDLCDRRERKHRLAVGPKHPRAPLRRPFHKAHREAAPPRTHHVARIVRRLTVDVETEELPLKPRRRPRGVSSRTRGREIGFKL